MADRYPGEMGLEHDVAQDAAPGQTQEATVGQAQEPTVLAGCFELQEVIGGGGMAMVYRAWDRTHRRPCAVKVLADVLARDEQFRLRFRQEAQAARGLTHPHIVAVYDCGESAPHHYIVMEYVARGTLRELLKREGTLQEATAARLGAEIADALAYAHGRGVIHRDIKPQNILLTEDGAAKVADFGIARTLDTTNLTRTGFLVGSVQYLSPEQARGDPAGPASDLYALGVVLFEMLAGHVPFDGDSAVGIALKHLGEPPPDLRQIRPDISESMIAIVARLLAKSDADRYPDAAALAVDLHRIASQASRHRPQTTAVGEVAAATREFVPAPAPDGNGATQVQLGVGDTAPLPRARGGHSRWSARHSAIAIAILLLAAAGVYLWQMGHRAAVSPTARSNSRAAVSATAAPVDNVATVPSLVGRTVAAASRAAGALELQVVVAEQRQDPTAAAGTILAQDPPAGGRINKGASLKVVVSRGTGIVPDLQGLSIDAATSRLEAVGLRLGRTIEGYGLGSETTGKILSQTYAPGTHLTPGEAVDVVVSKGPLPGSPQGPASPPSQQPQQPPAPPSPQPSNP